MENIIKNFNQIAHNYRAIFCDLWGCIHNGRESFQESLEALLQFRNTGGRVILVTNAPRPSASVIGFLDNLGITNKFYDSVVTSGDTTKISLQTGEFGYNIYHIGPKRDLCFFDQEPTLVSRSNKVSLVSISDASSIVCTGLFNDHVEYLNHLTKDITGEQKLVIMQAWDNPESLSKNFEILRHHF